MITIRLLRPTGHGEFAGGYTSTVVPGSTRV
jgi:hypothetical protein